MKYLLRQFVASMVCLYVTSQILPGLVIKGAFVDFLFAALILTAGFVIIKPIISVLTLPLSILTLGLFSAVGTVAVIFIMTKVDPHVLITPFYFKGWTVYKYSIPSFQANLLLSYVLISVTIQLVYKFVLYLFE